MCKICSKFADTVSFSQMQTKLVYERIHILLTVLEKCIKDIRDFSVKCYSICNNTNVYIMYIYVYFGASFKMSL